MATYAEQIGIKIRIHRQAKNWTQEQLAEASNTTASYIGQLERGEKDVRISTIEKIARALDMSINELFDDKQEGFWKEQEWAWESTMLLLKHPKSKQYQAYRILRELLEPVEPKN